MTTELIEFEGEGYLFLSGFEQSKKKECSITNEDILLNLNAQELIDSI